MVKLLNLFNFRKLRLTGFVNVSEIIYYVNVS